MSSAFQSAGSIQGFRPDIEGLRAVAVIMVLLYHLDIGWASGGFAGVDVFFVISGFLITGLLAKEVEKTGRVSLLDFYARRAKRLFPAAALVLAATAALTVWLLPRTRWQDIGGDIVASAAYLINWRLAARSVDYLAEDAVPSPVQHFWSLAVEEQYYIVWPVLLVAALWIVRGRIKPTSVLLGVTAAVGIPSLVYSILHTASSPATAYFITTTRMWELAIGAAVALLSPRLSRLPGAGAQVLGWTGVAGLAATLLLVSTKTPWPSYFAAIPTLSTAAVIAAGFAAGPRGPVALLGSRTMCWVGGISYSLYLWHWPLIQFAKVKWGTELPMVVAAGAAAISIALAWVTLRLVENPIRFSEQMRDNVRYALSTGINFSLAGVVLGLSLMLAVTLSPYASAPPRGERLASEDNAIHTALGAQVLTKGNGEDPALIPVDLVASITPSPERATADVPDAYNQGCQLGFGFSQPRMCLSGVVGGRVKVALIGDSKAMQWLPALQQVAAENDWEIQINTKSSCGFHDLPQLNREGTVYSECSEWNKLLLTQILGSARPQIAFVSMGGGSSAQDTDQIDALKRRWRLMTEAGIQVVVIANNPHPGRNVYECVSANPSQLSKCAFPRKPAPGTASMREAASDLPGVTFIDLNDYICAQETCSAVVGNVLVYRQGSHLTATYVRSLTNEISRKLTSLGVISNPDSQQQHERNAQGRDEIRGGSEDGLVLHDKFRILMDRELVDKNGVLTRRIRFSYEKQSRDRVFSELVQSLRDQEFRIGRIIERSDGSIATNFQHENGQRIALSVTPNGPLSGEGFMSIPRK